MTKQYYGGKGSITEGLVLNTIKWYLENKIAYFQKSYAPSIYNLEDVKYTEKGDVDFYGVYKGKYISFEVKETKKDKFLISQVKQHQLDFLQKIKNCGGISFLIINFYSHENGVWIINTDKLIELINNKKKSIKIDEIKNFGINIHIEYPGIIDWISHLENI